MKKLVACSREIETFLSDRHFRQAPGIIHKLARRRQTRRHLRLSREAPATGHSHSPSDILRRPLDARQLFLGNERILVFLCEERFGDSSFPV
jgi:hypothetical protein